MLVLRQVAGGAIRDAIRADRRIADRQPADLRRRGHVALDQRRRDAEHVGDVVEAAAESSGGSSDAGVDVEREQIADGVARTRRGSADGAPARRDRLRRRRAIDLRLEP